MTKATLTPHYVDNPAVAGKASFATVTVSVAPVIASWRESLFAHEWLNPDGTLKQLGEQSPALQEKRKLIEEKLNAGQDVERPVLGIGILDTVEIGAGRDTLLTLAATGIGQISVHIPKSHMDEFRLFIKN
jgi:hypothetical protein